MEKGKWMKLIDHFTNKPEIANQGVKRKMCFT